MSSSVVSIEAVRHSLRAVHAARPLVGSPLLDLAALVEAMRTARVAESPEARASFLPRWLDEIVWEQLSLSRGGTTSDNRPPKKPENALAAAASDFQAGSPDREAWSLLYLYFFSGRTDTLRQLASALPLGFNTVRRRLDHGYRLLAETLTAKEHEASAAVAHGRSVPQPLTRFIGREAELGAIRAQMAAHRLVVLTGPGGIGKSRLAIRLAHDLAADYPDGAYFIEVASLTAERQAPQAVMSTLGLRESPGRTHTDTLTEYLADKRLLLVIDNCEHLVTACSALINRLLRHSDALQVLATSREELHVDGAAHWSVPPMALPRDIAAATAGNLIHFDAPRLFSARAAAMGPGFQLTDANAAQVGGICARLDGLPLAIELAAARMQHLTVDQLETRLADRFALLKDGRHASRRGHETLRAMMDWSYDLLSVPEQQLLQRLAVFQSGWTLEAAEAVCAGEGIETGDILELLTHLVAKSLVQVADGEFGPRYGMLETVREYAEERLDEAGDVKTWRDKHAEYVVDFVMRAKPNLKGPESETWLRRLGRERADIYVALERSIAHGDVRYGCQLIGAMYAYWDSRGEWSEGRELMSRVLALYEPSDVTEEYGSLRLWLGNFALLQGDYGVARPHLEQALALARELKSSFTMLRALSSLGIIAEVDDYDLGKAKTIFEQALAISRQCGDLVMEQALLNNLGVLANRLGDVDEAERFAKTAVEIARARNDLRVVAHCLRALANIHINRGNFSQARQCTEEGLEICRRLDAVALLADAHCELGEILSHEGEVEAAIAAFEEGTNSHRERNRTRDLVYGLSGLGVAHVKLGHFTQARDILRECFTLSASEDAREELIVVGLESLAMLELAEHRPRRAARLISAAEAMREAINMVRGAIGREFAAQVHTAAGEALGEAERDAAHAEGQAMTTDQAVAYALEQATWEGAGRG